MLNVKTSVVGDAQIARAFHDAGANLRSRLRRTLLSIGEEIRGAASGRAPSRTGALAHSIRARLVETDQKLTLSVAPGKYYARFMEFGVVNHGTTRNRNDYGGRARVRRMTQLRAAGAYRIRPRPFMGPAFDAMRDRIDSDLAAAVEQAVTGVA